METGGYDVVAEVNEILLNRFLKLGHCIGKFPVFTGVYSLPIADVPESLQEFMDIGYEVSLNEAPTIDFKANGSIVLNVRGQSKFTVLGGIEFELEAEFTIGVLPSFNQYTRQFHIEFVDASIDDVELNDTYHLPANVIIKLNEVLAIAMEEYLTYDITTIELSPVLYSLELPYMPPGDANKLSIGMGNVKVLNNNVMAAAANLLGYTGGLIGGVHDFTDGNHVGVGVNENAMHRVYDFWWQRTTHPKSVTQTASKDFDMPDIVDWVDELVDWVAAVLTLGIVDVDIDIDRVWADFGATVRFGKFNFDMKPGNKIMLNGSISADIWLKAYVQITETTELFWGLVDVDETTSTIKLFDLRINGLNIDLESAEAHVYLDSSNQLTADITDLDITFPLPWDIPEFLLDYVVDWVVDQVVDNLPPLVLFPAIIEETIPDTTITVEATVNKLFVDESEALVAANIETSGIGSYAPYVANNNPESLEVHKRDCEWAHRTAYRHREYYCDLEKAFADGYDGCAYCLPKYHHR
jgi:hypothetical protein